jgi:hypothetical protein
MRRSFFFLAWLAFAGMLTGCSIHEKENGKSNNVDIRTPFGSLKVQEGHTDVKDTGLALYPGARSMKDLDEEHHSANVDISSSLFGLKVVALKFESDDAPDKVLDFYRKEMGKYGKVVDCTGGFNMNFHHHDKDADVTCEGHGSGHQYTEELKVGTENNQRVMAVKPRGNGSEFALVYVRAWEHKETM